MDFGVVEVIAVEVELADDDALPQVVLVVGVERVLARPGNVGPEVEALGGEL